MTKSSGSKKSKPSAKPAASKASLAATEPDNSGATVTFHELFSPAARRQIYFWFVTLLVLVLFLYMFRSILLPFVAGMALAYLLDPVADRLEAMGASRLVELVRG